MFNDFSNLSGLTLNGNAAAVTTGDGAVMRLVPASEYQVGTVFSTTTIRAATFSTYFKFRITDRGGTLYPPNTVAGADGLVFVVQNVSSSIGALGGGMGYSGVPTSVGVAFDTWWNDEPIYNDPSSNHVEIDTNGVVNHGAYSPANSVDVNPDFDLGDLWYVWIDYDGTSLQVRANQSGIRPAPPLLSRDLNIPSILGADDAYVGFSAGTGADYGNHDILSWEYRDSFNPINQVPEPSTLIIWSLLGLLTVAAGWWGRQKIA
jgi:hypothetical protein